MSWMIETAVVSVFMFSFYHSEDRLSGFLALVHGLCEWLDGQYSE